MEVTPEHRDAFQRHLNKFYLKCVEDNIVPSARLQIDITGIRPVIDFFVVDNKEKVAFKKQLLKQ